MGNTQANGSLPNYQMDSSFAGRAPARKDFATTGLFAQNSFANTP
jgi:hypothetical protein